MTAVGQARGRLAHAQFAMSMLEKGVVVPFSGQDLEIPVLGGDSSGHAASDSCAAKAERCDDGRVPDLEDRDECIAKLREECDQAREENQQLRQYLAEADKRCSTAVRLLQEAQDVLQRSGGDCATMELKELEAELAAGPPGMAKHTSTDTFDEGSTVLSGSDEHRSSLCVAQPPLVQSAPPATPQSSVTASLPTLLACPSMVLAKPGSVQVPVMAAPAPQRMTSCPAASPLQQYRPLPLPKEQAVPAHLCRQATVQTAGYSVSYAGEPTALRAAPPVTVQREPVVANFMAR